MKKNVLKALFVGMVLSASLGVEAQWVTMADIPNMQAISRNRNPKLKEKVQALLNKMNERSELDWTGMCGLINSAVSSGYIGQRWAAVDALLPEIEHIIRTAAAPVSSAPQPAAPDPATVAAAAAAAAAHEEQEARKKAEEEARQRQEAANDPQSAPVLTAAAAAAAVESIASMASEAHKDKTEEFLKKLGLPKSKDIIGLSDENFDCVLVRNGALNDWKTYPQILQERDQINTNLETTKTELNNTKQELASANGSLREMRTKLSDMEIELGSVTKNYEEKIVEMRTQLQNQDDIIEQLNREKVVFLGAANAEGAVYIQDVINRSSPEDRFRLLEPITGGVVNDDIINQLFDCALGRQASSSSWWPINIIKEDTPLYKIINYVKTNTTSIDSMKRFKFALFCCSQTENVVEKTKNVAVNSDSFDIGKTLDDIFKNLSKVAEPAAADAEPAAAAAAAASDGDEDEEEQKS